MAQKQPYSSGQFLQDFHNNQTLSIPVQGIPDSCDCFTARRGKGFMQGLVVSGRPVGELVKAALANGLIVLSAGSDVLRLVPPLVITEKDIDEMVEKLEAVLS